VNFARDWHNVVILRLADVPGVPRDLAPVTLVYSKGDSQDVIALNTGDVDLTIRTSFETPLEETSVRAIIREAPYDRTD
jgi:hypothetical protein